MTLLLLTLIKSTPYNGERMTKITGVILFFVLAFFLSFFSIEIKEMLTIQTEPATISEATSLDSYTEIKPITSAETAERKEKMEIMKSLLTQDFEEARKRMIEFYNKNQSFDSPLNKVSDNSDDKYENINRLSALLITPSPTLHPKIEKILAETSGKSYQLKAENPVPKNIGDLLTNPKKTHYTIALLGDSMIDTLGKELPHLQNLLSKDYPDYTFTLLNYGQGGTDLESGLFRLTNQTKYLDNDYPPLLSQNVDILVVESFAYNHWSGHFYDLDRQWLTIAKIIDTVKINSPKTKIILAATIAPNTKSFGDGKLNWPPQLKWDSATITKGYLQNLINFATSENYPLADAYHPSLNAAGDGDEKYINQSDHIHPSEEGALLFSKKILETIKQYKMIE